jgi:hypothetical protein
MTSVVTQELLAFFVYSMNNLSGKVRVFDKLYYSYQKEGKTK